MSPRLRFWLLLAPVLLVLGVGFALAPASLGFGTGLVLVAAIGTLLINEWRDRRAQRRFRAAYRGEGRDLLLVYSRSPVWQGYIEASWIPRWRNRAVVLDWSDRRRWDPALPEVALFRAFAGRAEFNPLAIVVTKTGDVRVIRFWRAFRDFKHGKDAALRAAEAELERALGGEDDAAGGRDPAPGAS